MTVFPFYRYLVTALALLSGLLVDSASAATEPAPKKRPRLDRYGDPLPPRVIARLGTVRLSGVWNSLTFSPDGKFLAGVTGNAEDRAATIWEVATGREVRRINGLDRLEKLAFSPDGKYLACSGQRCWVVDAASGKQLYTVAGASGAFSGDSKMLVTSGTRAEEPEVYVWDAATGRQLRQWRGEKENRAVLSSVGGRTLAILLWEHHPDEVEIHDIATGKKLRSLRGTARSKANPGRADGWRYATLSRDDRTLAVTNGDAVELLDVDSGKTLFTWRGGVPNRCVFSPDSKRIAWTGSGKLGRGMAIWVKERDGDKMRVIHERSYDTDPPCFSPDGKLVAALTGSEVTVHDAVTGKEVSFLDECDRNMSLLALTPDGRHVLTRAGESTFFVREACSGRLLRRVSVPLVGREHIEHVLPEGRLLTVDPDRNLVRLRNLRTGEVDREFATEQPSVGRPLTVLGPDNRYVAIDRRDESVAVFDLRTGKCQYRLDAGESRQGLKLSADADVLVWCNRADGKAWHSQLDGKADLHMRHHSTGKTFVLPNLPKADSWVSSFQFHSCLSPNGRLLILPTREGPMRRWDATTGMELSPLAEPLHGGSQLCWSPDHRVLAVRGSPDPIQPSSFVLWEWGLWDVTKGVRLKHLKLPNSTSLVRFAPDGRTLLSDDSQGVIHLWEMATGEERDALMGHLSYGVGDSALSADGRILVSGGGSQILVWDLTGRNPDGKWRPSQLSPEQRRASWNALAARDAKAAYAAHWELVADPEGTLAWLCEHLRPMASPEPGQVARLITELDAARFSERERAAQELEKFGQTIVTDLRQMLSQKPSLEVRRRIEVLLEKVEGLSQGRELQALRALEVIEHIGTPEARNLIRKIAAGASGTRLTEQAREALNRLMKDNSR
ncbi:MAG TPA: WD40 repeat domain-containing protein [Gemmataceae bacterium]|jgi:WD40 repeat protein